jgi:eukaryotic-like serine/threonine-protein kinase
MQRLRSANPPVVVSSCWTRKVEEIALPESQRAGPRSIAFLRQKDYQLVKELGQGACGMTVLLYDELVDDFFVCKKYVPYSEDAREALFSAFVSEIRLLHKVHHDNVVRVFNYYLYPEQYLGYILMEYVEGTDIVDYVKDNPERANEVFLQALAGFRYLEDTGILHRDIRPTNIMVTKDGVLKIIDLGFGKRVETPKDFDKSISLNWWCHVPDEFADQRYDFATEVYFVGMLFDEIIRSNDIRDFMYKPVVAKMCTRDPDVRYSSFAAVQQAVRTDLFQVVDFTDRELDAYREFSRQMCSCITKLETGRKYQIDLARLRQELGDVFRSCMLEEVVPDAARVVRCFIQGNYYYKKNGLEVEAVREFLWLLSSCGDDKGRIALANLHTALDGLPTYDEQLDDIPF